MTTTHELTIHRRQLGRPPIRGMGMKYGTTARYSCGDWRWKTNEYPPSRGGEKAARKAHAEHVMQVTSF